MTLLPTQAPVDSAAADADETSRARLIDDAVETTLARLLGEVARGDEGALAAVYDLVSPRVYALITRAVPDQAAHAGILEQAFVDVWQRASTYSPGDDAWAWLRIIAFRRAAPHIARPEPREIGLSDAA
ncbi:sigma factor [Microbacterium sp. NPDC089189]|uniref:sigma factor n=1 Tax=Microbacterium sp. NPDC089189 TaxID=3154972 RepID=UPI00342B1F8D